MTAKRSRKPRKATERGAEMVRARRDRVGGAYDSSTWRALDGSSKPKPGSHVTLDTERGAFTKAPKVTKKRLKMNRATGKLEEVKL